jgi:TonB family protein
MLKTLSYGLFMLLMALAQQSNNAEALFNRGEAQLQSKNYSEAIKEFEKVIKLKPEWAEAHFKLGVAHSQIPYTDKGKAAHTKAAIEAFEMAIRLKPAWAEAHNELGLRILSLGDYEKAVAPFKEAIRLKPEFAEAHLKLGVAYIYQARYAEGIDSLKEAIRIDPNVAQAHKLLGLTYVAVEKRDLALQQYGLLETLDTVMANDLLGVIQRPEKFKFGVTNGRLLSTPKPEYPDAARRNNITGRVTVHVSIDPQGNVTSAKAVSGPLELRQAAETAALKARFEPTRLSGTAVSVNGAITYDFSPQ